MGAFDNFMLQLIDDAVYGIKIPGHKFQEGLYEIRVKAMKEHTADNRSAGEIKMEFEDGTTHVVSMKKIERAQWMIIKEVINIDKPLKHMTLLINKEATRVRGNVLFDQIFIRPHDEKSREIQENHKV